jgi:hypothetical protein
LEDSQSYHSFANPQWSNQKWELWQKSPDRLKQVLDALYTPLPHVSMIIDLNRAFARANSKYVTHNVSTIINYLMTTQNLSGQTCVELMQHLAFPVANPNGLLLDLGL